jgi:hypothetical protein
MSKRVSWVSAKEYASSRGYSAATVTSWCRSGKLGKGAKKAGRSWSIRPDLADAALGVSEPVGDGTESVREYASRCGCTVENIKKLIKAGRLEGAVTKNEKGHWRIDPEKADQLRAATAKKKPEDDKPAPPRDPGGEIPAFADIEEATRLEKVWKARTAKLRHEEAEGTLINREKARVAVFAAAKELRERLDRAAVKLRDRLAGEDDPGVVQELMEKEHRQALEAVVELLEKGELKLGGAAGG